MRALSGVFARADVRCSEIEADMSALGGLQDRAELAKRLFLTAVALVVFRAGGHIPLPGLDTHALAKLGPMGGDVIGRLSIFALGVTPLVTVLILMELLKVLAPRVRRWEHASARNQDLLSRVVVALALIAAAAQAFGLAAALEDVKGLVDEPDIPFRLVCVATLVTGAAITIWLADQITRNGLGSGVWLLLITPALAELPRQLAYLAYLVTAQAQDTMPGWEVLLGCAFALLTLAAIVGLMRAGGGALLSASTSLWSLLLAETAVPWLLLAAALLVGGGGWDRVMAGFTPGDPATLAALAGLVVVFAHLYVRSLRIANPAVTLALPIGVFAAALAAIALADRALAIHFDPRVPLVGNLIIIAVVTTTMLSRWWKPQLSVARAQ